MAKRSGGIQQRGACSWRIRYTNNDGIRQSETIAGNREDAERELKTRLADLAKGLPVSSRPNTVLFEELAADVLTDYRINGYSSFGDQEARFRLHILPVFGRRKAAQITTADLKRYVVMRQSEASRHAVPSASRPVDAAIIANVRPEGMATVTVGTINRELELIRHTFLLAYKGRKILVYPHVPMLRENNVRAGFFTRAEVECLTKHLREPLASMVWFGFLTGWRLEECRGLLWSNVDFAHGEVRINVGSDKNREGRIFPMTAELRGLLDAIRVADRTKRRSPGLASVDSAHVTALTQRVFAGVGSFKKSWKTACYRAGLPCIVKPITIRGHQQFEKDGSPKVKVIKALRTFHDLRRSAARELQRQGYTDGQIMRMCGWKTRSMFERYNVVTDEDIRERMRRIEEGHREFLPRNS